MLMLLGTNTFCITIYIIVQRVKKYYNIKIEMEILIGIQHTAPPHTRTHIHTLAIPMKCYRVKNVPITMSVDSPDLDPGLLETVAGFRSRTRKVQGEPKTFYYSRS